MPAADPYTPLMSTVAFDVPLRLLPSRKPVQVIASVQTVPATNASAEVVSWLAFKLRQSVKRVAARSVCLMGRHYITDAAHSTSIGRLLLDLADTMRPRAGSWRCWALRSGRLADLGVRRRPALRCL